MEDVVEKEPAIIDVQQEKVDWSLHSNYAMKIVGSYEGKKRGSGV